MANVKNGYRFFAPGIIILPPFQRVEINEGEWEPLHATACPPANMMHVVVLWVQFQTFPFSMSGRLVLLLFSKQNPSSRGTLSILNIEINCGMSQNVHSKDVTTLMALPFIPLGDIQEVFAEVSGQMDERIDDIRVAASQEVTLVKEGGSLGFSIIGGTDHSCMPFGATEPGIFISHQANLVATVQVVPGGIAARSGKLRMGDRILKVNDEDVTKSSHQEAVMKLLKPGDEIVLTVQHDPLPEGYEHSFKLGENPQTIRENTGILLEASKAIGLEVNPEKMKYMIMSRDENIVRNGNIKIGNLSFEEVEKFKYLGATVTNINDTREEIKRRINMGNACYYSVEKLLSSSLLSKNLKVRIYKTVISPVALYGCETWTLTLREEHRLMVFENKVLRKIFGAKRDEVTGEWRKLHNTEVHTLYSSPDIIRNIKSRRLRWAGHVARMGESRNAYRVLVGRLEGKRPLGRPRRRWEDNIKMDLREVGYDDRDWINLPQDRDRWRAYVRAAMNLRVP
ncbi:hypothetical protein ANN_05632 [Periplaneta americana]|uniref:PDZ domain-containing protein n=1 Tax=Periplaneta americana TaxID=6978 RepID=A0ABQ8TBC6_PERAM|nr:hypothetical protein ANN_05632 [Periplaneta americana]